MATSSGNEFRGVYLVQTPGTDQSLRYGLSLRKRMHRLLDLSQFMMDSQMP